MCPLRGERVCITQQMQVSTDNKRDNQSDKFV
jgi:hypothetical protein